MVKATHAVAAGRDAFVSPCQACLVDSLPVKLLAVTEHQSQLLLLKALKYS